ncbi:MAG: lipoate--protein ligase family protein [Acidobacteria bacterium]|nr:lipoate--protein ligase family protein [Acidobacteriota bacterium]
MKTALPIRLVNLGLTDSWRTQAVYHALAEAMRAASPDTIIVCRPREPYLCLGYHQVFDAALDRRECRRQGWMVLRRRLGGGATYLDSNQYFYQCVFHHSRVPVPLPQIYDRMLAGPVATLRRLGLNARLREINEIEVDGRRIAGTGGGRIGEACVVVGNFLFDFDYGALPQVWRAPWDSFRELAAEALRDRLVTLRRLGVCLPASGVETILSQEFARALGRPLQRGALTPAEERHARRIALQISSDAALSLHAGTGPIAPMDTLKISAGVSIRAAETRIDGCAIRASFRVRDGAIEQARLDSHPARSWRPVEERLQGLPWDLWKRELQLPAS